ncbi:pirin family protein [Chitinimonas arctica]|uniref:Pirin family protein n=1 Tax=Chitinimonas arctica TaxID=2594795 RepID=A0A516SJV7_9NEIS|nr:pirin family protein [Chitinimonas arctica]QDQ28442.1 pirin family protein [Chitinimonas arctica]
MLTLRRSADRGYANHGWLKSFHSFSFAEYYDPVHMGFGALRVINEDRVAAGAGFGTHSHRDMEILSYVLAGGLAHRDSMGNGSVLKPGDVQRMSAGRGVMHSEYNGSQDDAVHFLQIWLQPNVTGIAPGYEEKHFDAAGKRGRLQMIANADGSEGAMLVHQDVRLYAGLFDDAEAAHLSLAIGRRAYVHLVRGLIKVNGQTLEAGDAAMLVNESDVHITEGREAEVLVFDLA